MRQMDSTGSTSETDQSSTESQAKYSDEFNAENAEVVYESSDGIRFRIHVAYLRAHTEGMAPLPGSTFEEVVPLLEPASVLALLFKFIYPRRQPDLESLEFDVLQNLAEASEKYQVYPAMYASYLRMRGTLPNHAIQILSYALKHDYSVLINEAAPLVLDVKAWDVLKAIPADRQEVWLEYHHKWQEVHTRALTTHLTTSRPSLDPSLVSGVSGSLIALYRLDETFGDRAISWKSLIAADITRIPQLSELVTRSRGSVSLVSIPTTTALSKDLCIECGDKIELWADIATLTAFAPKMAEGSFDNRVRVPEKSITMRRLLQFLQPTRCLDVGALDFVQLEELALAAEKYSVYQAMQMCKIFMKNSLPAHAENIFMYAARSGYYDILDASAHMVLHLTFDHMDTHLPPPLRWSWARYFSNWQDICAQNLKALSDHGLELRGPGHCRGPTACMCPCGLPFSNHTQTITKKLLEGPRSLWELKDCLREGSECEKTRSSGFYKRLGETTERAIKAIPPFSTFIDNSDR